MALLAVFATVFLGGEAPVAAGPALADAGVERPDATAPGPRPAPAPRPKRKPPREVPVVTR